MNPLAWANKTLPPLVRDNFAMLVATGNVLLVLFVVPQTAAILAKATFADAQYDMGAAVLRVAGFVITVLAYVMTFLAVLPPRDMERAAHSRVGRARLWVLNNTERTSVGVMTALGSLSANGRRVLGALVLAVAVAVMAFIGPHNRPPIFGHADFAGDWPAIVIAGFGAWVALVPEAVLRDHANFHWGWRVPARLLVAIGALSAIGQLLWALPEWTGGYWTTLPYTFWGVGFLLFLTASAGRILDAWSTQTDIPVRLIAAVGALVLLASSDDELLEPGPRAPAATQSDWYDDVNARLDAMSDGPVLLVAASGGGSRAALFAALTYQALEDTHFGDDPKAPTLGSHILLISSVSGGSLASAYYQHAIAKDGALRPRPTLRNVSISGMKEAMLAQSTLLMGRAGKLPDRMKGKRLLANFEATRNELTNWPQTPLPDAPWLATSAFVDDMATDFMASVLRAVLEPNMTRGQALTRLWTTRFGLADLNNAPGQTAKAPLVLYNSTEVASGRRYVIGLPRLPEKLLLGAVGSMDDANGDTWVTAGEAARLSANFPWGFDVVRLTGKPRIQLLDGGIVDNTGVDTLAQLFQHLSLAAGEGRSKKLPAGVSPEQSQKAQRLLERLRTRGVLLVEIDAGARPGDGDGGGSLMASLTRPLQALDAAGTNNAFAARDGNVDMLARVLDEAQGRFLHFTWVCNQLENVQTAWSLGTRDQALTTLQFLAEQRRLSPFLKALDTGFHDNGKLQREQDASALAMKELEIRLEPDTGVTEEERQDLISVLEQTNEFAPENSTVIPEIDAPGVEPLPPEAEPSAAEGALPGEDAPPGGDAAAGGDALPAGGDTGGASIGPQAADEPPDAEQAPEGEPGTAPDGASGAEPGAPGADPEAQPGDAAPGGDPDRDDRPPAPAPDPKPEE